MKLTFLLFATLAYSQTWNWTLRTTSKFPMPRARTALAYDSAHGQVVLFGGSSSNNTTLSDTWVWDGVSWTQKFPTTSPKARQGHAMAYDAVRGVVVLFGGEVVGVGEGNDTWTWDGSNWTAQTGSLPPPARAFHNMVFDSARSQVVLFGGSGTNINNLNDTWVWNGLSWAQKPAGASPPPRDYAVMAYDAVRSQTVLFGGLVNKIGVANDTWIWDGTAWTQQAPQTSPPIRYVAAMAYDTAQNRTILFGGWGANSQILNDTWAWDGSNWTAQSPASSPAARHDCAMAHDSAHSQVVLFGGVDSTFTYGDTWTWQVGAAPPPGPAITNVISASAFGGFTTVAPGSWVEIYGTGLAPDSRSWAGADFSGSTAPASLDGVQVTIAGQKAAVAYISATQVNAQLPSNIPSGAQQITVTNGTTTSAPVSVKVNAAEPGLLAPASFIVGGKQYLVALLPDNSTYILPPGTISGINARQVHPGETTILYGVGFGPVVPSVPAGQIVNGANQLGSNLQIVFGGVPAQVTYDGLAPGFVGLYQFNVVVPQVADNDLTPITFALGGVPGTQVLYTSVKQ